MAARPQKDRRFRAHLRRAGADLRHRRRWALRGPVQYPRISDRRRREQRPRVGPAAATRRSGCRRLHHLCPVKRVGARQRHHRQDPIHPDVGVHDGVEAPVGVGAARGVEDLSPSHSRRCRRRRPGRSDGGVHHAGTRRARAVDLQLRPGGPCSGTSGLLLRRG